MTQDSAEKLEHTETTKRKSGLSATERAVSKYLLVDFAKKKRNRSVRPDHQIVKWESVKLCESRTLARKRMIGDREGGGKGGLHSEKRQVLSRKGKEIKKNLPRRSRRKYEGSVDAKAFQEDKQSLGFTPSLAKPIMGKGIGRRRAR